MPKSKIASVASKRDYLGLLEERGRRLARQRLGDFARYIAPADYQFNWHHDVLYRWLDDFAAGLRKRVIVEMPPGHGKSEGVSRNLPAYLLGRNPDARVIACSYTADLASEMNRDVQRIIDGELYREIFPGTRLGVPGKGADGRRNADIFDVAGRRGYYKSAGVGSGITGRRFDFGIIDDPIKDRLAANSPTQREATWRWYTSTFSTRKARGAGILITATRWHTDDLIGRLKAKEAEDPKADRWDVLTLPSPAPQQRHPDDPRQPGEALWPWFFGLEDLERQRLLDARDFAALYLQDPRGEGGTEWPAEYFPESMWFSDWPEHPVCSALALDPSQGKGEKKKGCYASFVEARLDARGVAWLECWASQTWDASELARRMVVLVRERQPRGCSTELNGGQEVLAHLIRQEATKLNVPLPLYGFNNDVDKELRIRSLGPLLAQGRVRVRDTHSGRLLVQQLRDFPVGEFVDCCDAAEMACRLLLHLTRKGAATQGAPTLLR